MVDIIVSNTSPLLYLHRIAALDWLPKLGETGKRSPSIGV